MVQFNNNNNNNKNNFFNCHYIYRLHLEEDSSVPSYCRACGISVSLHSLQCDHMGGRQCKANIRRNQQRERNEAAAGAQARTFTIDDSVVCWPYTACRPCGRTTVNGVTPIYHTPYSKKVHYHLLLGVVFVYSGD